MIAFFVARRINRLGIPVMRARLDTDNLIEGETVEPPANGHKPEAQPSSRARSSGPLVARA